jgi:hypothetical protein
MSSLLKMSNKNQFKNMQSKMLEKRELKKYRSHKEVLIKTGAQLMNKSIGWQKKGRVSHNT